MPFSSTQITALQEQFTQMLGITDVDFLKTWIPIIGEAINTYCNRLLNKQTNTDKFRSVPQMRTFFFLRQFPVVSIASVTENGVSLVQDTDYELEPETGRLTRLTGGQPSNWMSSVIISVTYDAGYDPFPTDLLAPFSGIIEHEYQKKAQRDLGQADLAGVNKLTIFDVGAIETGEAGAYQSDTSDIDPLLGNYVLNLDSYRQPVATGGRAPHASAWLS